MLYVLPDFDLKQARSVVRIAARSATLQNLVLYAQGHSNYNIYIAETSKYKSHRGHIIYSVKNRNENIQNAAQFIFISIPDSNALRIHTVHFAFCANQEARYF